MTKLLEGFCILDFSHRLPGPMGGKTLADLGAKVIKVEDEKFKDPFLSGLFSLMPSPSEDSFSKWYQGLNEKKEVVRLDFSDPEIKQKIRALIDQADAIILGIPDKLQRKLGVHPDQLNQDTALAIIEAKSSKAQKPMHDLNAMAEAKLLDQHIQGRSDKRIAPPFLPLGGILFGQQLASEIIAGILRSQKNSELIYKDVYLFESIQTNLSPFLSDGNNSLYLHNGLYPCYNLYRLKDGNYAALAAVEDKFWLTFCDLFQLDLTPMDRFYYQDERVFKMLEEKFSTYSSQELLEKISQRNCCLSLVKSQFDPET